MTDTTTVADEASPVFVDHTGRRGRRLRGLGWVAGFLSVGCIVAMTSGLVGTQSQAPAVTVPGTADTTPPSQFVNAPPPTAPPGTQRSAAPTPSRSGSSSRATARPTSRTSAHSTARSSAHSTARTSSHRAKPGALPTR